MSGTSWTAPGRGVTASRLAKVLVDTDQFYVDLAVEALFKVAALMRDIGPDHQTNLALTGGEIGYFDLHRIACCE